MIGSREYRRASSRDFLADKDLVSHTWIWQIVMFHEALFEVAVHAHFQSKTLCTALTIIRITAEPLEGCLKMTTPWKKILRLWAVTCF